MGMDHDFYFSYKPTYELILPLPHLTSLNLCVRREYSTVSIVLLLLYCTLVIFSLLLFSMYILNNSRWITMGKSLFCSFKAHLKDTYASWYPTLVLYPPSLIVQTHPSTYPTTVANDQLTLSTSWQ